MKNLTFSQALEFLKQGFLLARAGWNGKNMFIFMRPQASVDFEMIQSLNSLPQAVKDWYSKYTSQLSLQNNEVVFTEYLCMKAAAHSIVNGWLASQTDIMATDWEVVTL